MATKKKSRKVIKKAGAGNGRLKRSSGIGMAAKGGGRNVDLEAVRRRIVNHVGGKAFDMVKNTSDSLTMTINVTAMKYLFEMIGLFPAGESKENSADDQNLAGLLMERLGMPQETREAVIESGALGSIAEGTAVSLEGVVGQDATLDAVE